VTGYAQKMVIRTACTSEEKQGCTVSAENGRKYRERQNMAEKNGIQRKQTWEKTGNGGTMAKKENNKYILVDIFLPNPL